MNCEKVSSLISAYLDREVNEEEERKIRHHLGFCPDCYKSYVELSSVKTCLDALPSDDLPKSFWVQTRVLMNEEAPKPKPWLKFLLTTTVATCISIYAAVGGIAPTNLNPATLTGKNIESGTTMLKVNTAEDRSGNSHLIGKPDDPFSDHFDEMNETYGLTPRSTLVDFRN